MAWVLRGNIRGPAGADGAPGPTGSPGPPGADGATGPQGDPTIINEGTGIDVSGTSSAPIVGLDTATQASLALADSAVQPARTITAGAGLTGGGNLSADRTLDVGAGTGITVNANDVALSSGTQASLALADSSVQPGDLATVATTGAYSDLTGTPTIPPDVSSQTFLTSTNQTATLPNSRRVLAGTNVTLDTSVGGQLTISASGGSGTVTSVTADETNVHANNGTPTTPVISLKDMAEATVKGRAEGAGTGQPTNLDMDDLRAMLHLGSGAEVRGASFVGFNAAISVPTNKVALTIKEDCTITKVVVLTTGGTGSCVIDIQKESYVGYPPDGADTICAAAKPTITSGIKYQDSTLTGWTTALSAGDTLQFELVSSSVFTAVFIFLIIQPVGSVAADGYTDARVRELIAEALAEAGIVVVGSSYAVTLFAGQFNDLILWDVLGQPSGAVTVDFTLPAGATIRGTSNVTPALDLTGFTSGSTINFTNLGSVLGLGGRGGDGAGISNTFGEDGGTGRRGVGGQGARDGANGGNAIKGPGSGITFNVTNAAGYIFGGGGGGGGGGASLDFGGDTNRAAGGGGGGGAGGGLSGRGGVAVASNTTTASQAKAADGTQGGAGRLGANGTGGAKVDSGSALGGAGGDGGAYGADGAAGASPTTFDRDYAGGSAGTAGKAIDLNGGAVTFVSGNNSTHVKGAVS